LSYEQRSVYYFIPEVKKHRD